jgi:hypothetical protein
MVFNNWSPFFTSWSRRGPEWSFAFTAKPLGDVEFLESQMIACPFISSRVELLDGRWLRYLERATYDLNKHKVVLVVCLQDTISSRFPQECTCINAAQTYMSVAFNIERIRHLHAHNNLSSPRPLKLYGHFMAVRCRDV